MWTSARGITAGSASRRLDLQPTVKTSSCSIFSLVPSTYLAPRSRNRETEAAPRAAERGKVKRFDDVDTLMADLNKDSDG